MDERRCGIAGCPKPYYAKGLCMKHRERQRNGVPLTDMVPIRTKINNLERDDHGRKQCSGCRLWFDLGMFTSNRSARDGLNQRCRTCCALQKLLTRYHLTLDTYADLLASQGGVCAVCGRDNGGKALCVDHDHTCCTGGESCGSCVRGLLCAPCNQSLGMMEDSPDRLRAAADYIESRRCG